MTLVIKKGFIQLRQVDPNFSLAPVDGYKAKPISFAINSPVGIDELAQRILDPKKKPEDCETDHAWDKIFLYRRPWDNASIDECSGWYYDFDGKPLPRGTDSYLNDMAEEKAQRAYNFANWFGPWLHGSLADVRENMREDHWELEDKIIAAAAEEKKAAAEGPKKKKSRREDDEAADEEDEDEDEDEAEDEAEDEDEDEPMAE